MDLLIQTVGAAIVIVALLDVFFTILFPASGHGPVRNLLGWAVWRFFRRIGATMTGQRRRSFLSYSGPILFTVTFTAWFMLLVVGWAMIYVPGVGTAITASSGGTDPRWATALYYSGFNLTTLGVGNVAANTALYRLLTVAEAAIGVAFFGMVVTYFLSVYSELTSRNAFAQGLHHLTGQTGCAAELLARLADGQDLAETRQHLSSKAEFLRRIYQTHRFYPVLRYFHYREAYYELPRILLIALDTATLVRCGLDDQRYARPRHAPAIDDLFEAAMCLMHELLGDLPRQEPRSAEAEVWQRHYRDALARLSESGVAVRADADAGAEEYLLLRARWDEPLRRLADLMLCDWQSIEPDGSGGRATLRL